MGRANHTFFTSLRRPAQVSNPRMTRKRMPVKTWTLASPMCNSECILRLCPLATTPPIRMATGMTASGFCLDTNATSMPV